MTDTAFVTRPERVPAQLPKGIRQRGNSFVADVTYNGTRRTGSASTVEDAILLRREFVAELSGKPLTGLARDQQATWTLGKAIVVASKVAWRGSAWGKRAVQQCEDLTKRVGKNAPLDTIDTWTLDAWVQDLEERGLADGTINRYLAAVSKVFTVAQERGGVASKPKFPRKKEAAGRIRYLTETEEAVLLSLLDRAGRSADRDLCVLLIDTGLRVGEALRLEARDVDLKAGLLSVWKTKSDLPRSVPMTKRVREIVERQTAAHPDGALMDGTRHSLRQGWDRARSQMRLADDPQFVPHALRHTCCSRLVQRGVPLKVVQEWMGHKSISVTLRYAHLAPANLLEAVKALESN